MIVNAGYRGKVGAAAPKFTYTGQYNVRKDGVVELLTSGTIVFLEPKVIDVFMVGGGGAGGHIGDNVTSVGCGGGGGGYTRTIRRISVTANQSVPVTIGAGGSLRQAGGASAFGPAYTVNGGATPALPGTSNTSPGAAGGSGGGGGVKSNSDYGAGGSDGANGETGYPVAVAGGKGQGFTTREFGEATGKLYAGGGGGGRYMSAQNPVISMGGHGGGGAGAWCSSGNYQPAAAGVANTGGGGGGRATYASYNTPITAEAGTGGSGIVCFRDAAELPELAGTWVLNERLYAPENDFAENINFKMTSIKGDVVGDRSKIFTENNKIKFMIPISATSVYEMYDFTTNTWYHSQYLPKWIFPAGATASDEFRAWLASNATKQ